jgi:hypothetical protein
MTAGESGFAHLLAEIATIDPVLAETTRQIEESWGSGDPGDAALTELVATTLHRAIEGQLFSLPTMIEGFNTFAHDFHDRQSDFLRSRTYRARDYEAVTKEVYANDTFMRTVYYPALLFGYLASPNYRALLRNLDRTLALWRGEGVTRLLEVASGHAFLLLFALRQLPGATGIGSDIAPAAGGFADSLHQITGWAPGRFQMLVTDVLDERANGAASGPFKAAICCELLEHVPEPKRFLDAIHARLEQGGRLFVSAAVRMESVDHLTVFESTESVASLLETAGFAVVEDMSVPFVTRRPRDAGHWAKLLEHPLVPATFIAHCRKFA